MIISDPEISNVIVTAGHGGLKFWDLRYICLFCFHYFCLHSHPYAFTNSKF